MGSRYTEQLGTTEGRCDICGHSGLVLTRSRTRRRGTAWVNPRFDPEPRTYEVCPGCGVRYRVEGGRRV